MKLPAFQLRPGDQVDLEGDPYADPQRDHIYYQSQYAVVVAIEEESDGVIAIEFDCAYVGFPRNHLLMLTKSGPEPERNFPFSGSF